MKISATQRHKAVRTIRFFLGHRQVRLIVDLKNNPNSRWFLPKTVQLTYRPQTNAM
jgi:hypothetical protein